MRHFVSVQSVNFVFAILSKAKRAYQCKLGTPSKTKKNWEYLGIFPYMGGRGVLHNSQNVCYPKHKKNHPNLSNLTKSFGQNS